ncbi:MAG: AAA family ATPase [Verrucomicrobiota bacterium]
MLIKNIKVSGLLSFGPKGIDLPMRKLNVLIGPNGSGKSNLLEVINLFRAAATGLARPVKDAGGIREWLWKSGGKDRSVPGGAAALAMVVANPAGSFASDIRHSLSIEANGELFELTGEEVAYAAARDGEDEPYWFYHFEGGLARLHEGQITGDYGEGTEVELFQDMTSTREIPRGQLNPVESILSQDRSPFAASRRYKIFEFLRKSYDSIQLHRDWCFGPQAGVRLSPRPDGRTDSLGRSGENLALMVASLPASAERRIIEELRTLYSDIEAIRARPVAGGSLQLFLTETGGVEISASRLSDGTLRYLSLLIILLAPNPAPVIVIEEPELGLHPDVIPQLARLLVEASERTQLVITTHSRMLIDALGDDPESVVVCEKHEGESVFERLDAERLKDWLEKYSLGDLWSKGELGGNRW